MPNVKAEAARQSINSAAKPAAKVQLKAYTFAGGYRVYGTLVQPRKRNVTHIAAAIQKLA